MNSIGIVLPSRPVFPSDTLTATAYGHATYTIASYSLMCTVTKELEITTVNIDGEQWMSDVRQEDNSSIVIVAILKQSDAASFDKIEGIEQLFTMELLLKDTASLDNTISFQCEINYLSNVLNEKIIPSDMFVFPSALIFDYNSTNDPHIGYISISEPGSPVGLVSYNDQPQIINLAYVTGNEQTFPINHFLVESDGQLKETNTVNCSTDSIAFHLNSDCSLIVLTGSETTGAEMATIVITYGSFTSRVFVRVWYPFKGAQLSVDRDFLYPVKDVLVKDDKNDCIQLWEKGKVELYIEYSFDSMLSDARNISLLPHIVDQLNVTSGHGVLDENGFVTPLSTGNIIISGGGNIASITITANKMPQNITTLDITIFSRISLTIPSETQAVSNDFRATTLLEQNFDSINSAVYIIASTTLSDGYTLTVSYEDGLKLTSLDQSVVRVSEVNDTLYLVGSGNGELLSGQWISQCNANVLAESIAYGSVTVPNPIGIDVLSSSDQITFDGEYADIAGIPTSVNIIISLRYPDNETRNIVSDLFLNVSIKPPHADIVSLVYITNDAIKLSLNGSQVLGDIVLIADYNNGELVEELRITAVQFSSLSLHAVPYPSYTGSQDIQVTTLNQIYPTGLFQQARLVFNMLLSDNTTFDITDSQLASFSTQSTIVMPTEVGVITVEGRFGSLTEAAILDITASDDIVVIASIDSLYLDADTLSGIAGESTVQLEASVTFNDSLKYPNFLPDGAEIYEGVVTLQSSADAVEIDSKGLITLVSNHYELVTVEVTSAGSGVTDMISFACNLEPAIGDADIGAESGIPIPPVNIGSDITIPLRINVGFNIVSKVEVLLFIDDKLEITSISRGSDWTGELEYTIAQLSQQTLISINTEDISTSGVIEFALIQATSLSQGLVEINGIIQTLTDINNIVIGNAGSPMVAGSMNVLVEQSLKRSVDSVKRKRESNCEIGDVDGDCIFDSNDVQYILSQLSSNVLNDSSNGLSEDLDIDDNAYIDPSDAYYLYRVFNTESYLLKQLSIAPASSATNCILEVNATLLDGHNQPPLINNTKVFFDFSVPFDISFKEQDEIDSSFLYHGSIVLSPKSFLLHGAIIQAEISGESTYRVAMSTNLTSSNIGLSIIIVTANGDQQVTPGRVQTLHGSPYSPFEYNYPLDIKLAVFANTIPLIAAEGYNSFDTIDNSLSSSECKNFVIARFSSSNYLVFVPEDNSIDSILVTVKLSAGSLDNSELQITSGNPNATFSLLQNGSLILNAALDYETIIEYMLTVTSSENTNQTMASAMITITVTDINDNTPMLLPIDDVYLSSNVPIGTTAFTIYGSDIDSSLNGMLKYIIFVDELELFNINAETGEVFVNMTINTTEELTYVLVVGAEDLGNPSRQAQINVSVTIAPSAIIFSSYQYVFNVTENNMNMIYIGSIVAEVTGNVQYTNIVYSFSDMYSLPFTIDQNNGAIKTIETLDREKNNSYVFNVEATTIVHSELLTTTAEVRVIVMDENDNRPELVLSLNNMTLFEDVPVPYELDLVQSVTDKDMGSNSIITFTLSGLTDSQGIVINAITGLITITESLDYENAPLIEFIIVATDNGQPALNDSVGFVIILVDVNDSPPQVILTPPSQTVNRSIPIGYVLAQLTITDNDIHSVNGNTSIALQNDYFGLDDNFSEIILTQSIVNVTIRRYNLSIIAQDVSKPSLTSNTFFIIYVDDDELNTPRFTNDLFTFELQENTSNNAIVVDLNTLLDPDYVDPFSNLQFSLINHTQGVFDININGNLYLNTALDFENTISYSLQVMVVDINHEDQLSSTTTITIIVLDVNDNPPDIIVNNTQLFVLTTISVNTTVLEVEAIDIDSNENSEIDLSLSSDQDVWILVDNEIKLNQVLVIDESITYYLTITAKDRGTPVLSSTLDIVIITDPFTIQFEKDQYTAYISENVNPGTELTNVTATTSGPSEIVYSLLNDSVLFSIDSLTGTIYSLIRFDFEEEEYFEFQVKATASPTATQSVSALTNISVIVINENDNGPYFVNESFEIEVKENIAINEAIIDLNSLIEDDDGIVSETEFKILSNNAMFGITSDNMLFVKEELDYENTTQYVFSITVTDPTNPSLPTNTSTFTILVTDINDNPPVITATNTNLTISSALPVGTSISQISTNDLDSGNNGLVTLSITGGANHWELNNGNLTIKTSLNILEKQTFVINVTATDHGNPSLESFEIIYIYVDPVLFVFDKSNYSVNVTENDMLLPLDIISILAELSVDGLVLYGLSEDTQVLHENLFAIDNITGILSALQSLDYEKINSYSLQIEASSTINDQAITASAIVTVNVVDINDNPPLFSVQFNTVTILGEDGVYNITTVEEMNVTIRLTVTDLDSPQNSLVQFGSIQGSASQFFSLQILSDSSVNIMSIVPLDRDTQTVYNISLEVVNEGHLNTFTSNAIFIISVTDINDNAPAFSQALYNVSLVAPIGVGTVVLDLNATDLDASLNGFIKYSLVGSSGLFKINESTGVIETTEDILTRSEFTINALATDSHLDLPLSDSVTVIVTVIDLVDGRQNDFLLQPDSGLGIISQVQSINSTSYFTRYGFALPHIISEPQNITVSLDSIDSMGQVQVLLEDPSSVNCIIVRRELWEDDRTFYLAAQVKNTRNHVETQPASVYARLDHEFEDSIDGVSAIDTETGSTLLSITVPLSWFENTETVSVSCGLDIDNLQSVGTITLTERSETLFDTDIYVYMELPLTPQLPGNTFEIPIYAESGEIAVGTYALQINCSNNFEILNVSTDSSVWSLASQTVSDKTDIMFTGLLADPFIIPAPDRVLLATVTAISNGDQPDDNAFSLTVHFLGTANKEKVLPPTGMDTIAGNASTYGGLQVNGEINATDNEPVGIFLKATTTDILNTAILTGEDISLPLKVLGILKSGELKETTSSLTCSSSHPASFDVSQDCSAITVTSSHTTPVIDALLTVQTSTGVTGILTLSIWTPVLPGFIEVLDSTLNLVPNWITDDINNECNQQYQRTKVLVSSHFTDSKNVIENVTINHLVTLSEGDSVVLTVDNNDNTVTGISPGMTQVIATTKDGLTTVGEIDVAVSSLDVQIEGLDVQVISNIELTPVETSINPFDDFELTITTEQNFNLIGSQATVIVSVIYSDGHRHIIDLNDGLTFSSLNQTIVEVTGNTVTAVANGTGVLIDVEWRVPDSCGGQRIAEGKGYVSVSLLDPDRINLLLETQTLSASNSNTEQIGIASSTMITQAIVEFANGEEVNIIDSMDVSLLQPSNDIMIDGNTISVTQDAQPGIHTIVVASNDYSELSTTINITIVQVTDLVISASPYPVYESSDSKNIVELKQIASSGQYQQALIHVDAMLSNENVQDVSKNTDLIVIPALIDTGIEANLIATDDGFVLEATSVDNSGTVTLSASLLSIPSSVQYSILVSTDSVKVSEIELQSLPNDTFNGVFGTTQQLLSTLVLEDGSVYTNLFMNIDLPNVVRFQQSSEQNAININESMGVLTLIGNSHSLVSVSVIVIDDASVTASIEFNCNLEPSVGDIDVGNTITGPPISTQIVGTHFTIPLYLNLGNSTLSFFEVSLSFDPSIIQVTEVVRSSQWPSTGVFGYTIGEPHGTLFIAGNFDSPNSETTFLTHLADITFHGDSTGTSYFNGTILNLIDENGLSIGSDSPKQIIAGSTSIVVVSSLTKRSFRYKREEDCQAGDVNGDCIFDVRDVAYLQSYYLDLLSGSNELSNISSEIESYLDCDKSGIIDPNDAIFMLRVAFELHRFVDKFQVLTVMEEKCFLNITISGIGSDNMPARPQSTSFLAYFTHSHSDFKFQFNSTNFTMGTVLDVVNGDNADIVQAESIGNGKYRIIADASILLNEVGVSLVQVTFDSIGNTAESRVAIMTQETQSSNSYSPFNFTVAVNSKRITVHRQLLYTPLIVFNNTLTTEQCIALMAPVQFNHSSYIVHVSEDAVPSIDVLQVGATVGHPDASITFTIDELTIAKYDVFPFVLDEESGTISTVSELDYEGISLYTFTVYATENRTLTNDSTIVEIIVDNVNDLSPVFEQVVNLTVNVPASAESGYYVIQINATDPDMLEDIVYSITASTLDGLFVIDNSTGVITVGDNLFPVNNTDFLLQVTASDSLFNDSTSLNLFIYLPFFTQNSYQTSLPEDTFLNTSILNINISNTFSEIFVFSLTPAYEFFSINSEGTITLSALLDYELDNGKSYSMSIVAISENFNLNSSLQVLVTDVNDNPPVFSADTYNIQLFDYLPLGTSLDIINVTDNDTPPNAILQYSLEPSTSTQFFTINNNGELVIASSLLNSNDNTLTVKVLVNDNVHSVNASIIIELVSVKPIFPVTPSFVTSTNTIIIDSLTLTQDMSSIELSQMFALLPGIQRSIDVTLGDQISTSLTIQTELSFPDRLSIHILHHGMIIYPHQNELVLVAQVIDRNNFASTIQTSIFVSLTHWNGTIELSCTTTDTYGRCMIHVTIPLQWFDSGPLVNLTATLENQPSIVYISAIQLEQLVVSTEQRNDSIVFNLPTGNFLPGELVEVNVYGNTHHAIAGYSITLTLDSELQLNDISFNSTEWAVSINSNESMHGIVGVLSTPSTEIQSVTNSDVHLFTLQLQLLSSLSADKDCILTATVNSLVDIIEGPVIIDTVLNTRTGPVYFANESGIHTIGSISAITDHIVAILPYIDQPVLLNTAILSAIPVQVPIEIWAGYSSGSLSLYTGTIDSCETTDFNVIKLNGDCRSLILVGDELQGGDVNVTLTVSGVIGNLRLEVYYPIFPIAVISSDSILDTVQLSTTLDCESNYQLSSLNGFVDFVASDSLITRVDITKHIQLFTSSSNNNIVSVNNDGTITGISAGSSSICMNIFSGSNPSCVNISVTDDPVHVTGLATTILQGFEVTAINAIDNEFLYNITIELDSMVQNVSQIIVSLQYTDNQTRLLQPNELIFQSTDPDIAQVSSTGEITALSNGNTNISVTWQGSGANCDLQITKVIPINVILLTPIQVIVSPSPNNVHRLTSSNDPSVVLGVDTSYEIIVLLEYSNGVEIEPNNIIYNISDSSLAEINNGILQGKSSVGLLNLTISLPDINTEVIIQFNIVNTVSALVSANPFPAFTNSLLVDVTSLAPIQNTLYWQQCQLGLVVTLTDGHIIDATQQIEGDLFTVSSNNPTVTASTSNNILVVTPLNGESSSGILTVSSILSQFIGIHKTITVVDTPIIVSSALVDSLPYDTLNGVQGRPTAQINVSIELEDNSTIHDILSISDQFLNIISIHGTTQAFETSSNGYLTPLLNTIEKQTLSVSVAEKFEQEITFFVNLKADEGDIDIGNEAGSPIDSASIGNELSLPLYINIGNDSLAYLELSFQYDSNIFTVSTIHLGDDWENGMYHYNTDTRGTVLLTSLLPEQTINGERAHIYTIVLNPISSTSETTFTTDILTIGYHGNTSTILTTTPYTSVASNVTITVAGNKKRDTNTVSIREKREVLSASGCNFPPCDCENAVSGDINSDCQFDLADLFQLLQYLQTDSLYHTSVNSTMALMAGYDVSLDRAINVYDAYVMFKALIGYVPLLDGVDIVPVQSAQSSCLFTITVTLSGISENNNVYMLISLETELQQNVFQETKVTSGELVTYHNHGGLVRAAKITDNTNEYTVALNMSVIGDVGVSVITQNFDANNRTSIALSTQYLGSSAPLYTASQLVINTSTLYFFTGTNGYSPLVLSSNKIKTIDCTDFPLIGEFVDIVFPSPYNATVVWELDNQRQGLSLSSQIYLTVMECSLDQLGEVLVCVELTQLPADSNTTAQLITQPFTMYTVTVNGPTTISNETSKISPEDGK